MSSPRQEKKPQNENNSEPNQQYELDQNHSSKQRYNRQTEHKDRPINPFNPRSEDTQMFGKKKNDDPSLLPWIIKSIVGLLGGGFALYILISLHLIDINNICIINFGSCGLAQASNVTETPPATSYDPPTLAWTETINVTATPSDCTLPDSWKLENSIFTMNISKVVISNVGGGRNMLIMNAQVTNRSGYYINLPLQANMRFLHENQTFGPSVAMSAWPGNLDPYKSGNWQIVVDQTPYDIGLLTLEFLGMSINRLFLMHGDEKLESIGVTSLSIPGIPGSC